MDYTNLYEKLYQMGYHGDGTNSGLNHTWHIFFKYYDKISSILDAGCSQGLTVKKYLERGLDAYGFDISPTAIKLAEENGLKGRCVIGNILQIPFSKHSVDAIVCTDVLEHLSPEDVDLALSELFRVARKYLFLRISKSIEGRKDWLRKVRKENPSVVFDIDNLHLSVFPHKQWQEWVEAKGSKLIEKDGKLMVFKIND